MHKISTNILAISEKNVGKKVNKQKKNSDEPVTVVTDCYNVGADLTCVLWTLDSQSPEQCDHAHKE